MKNYIIDRNIDLYEGLLWAERFYKDRGNYIFNLWCKGTLLKLEGEFDIYKKSQSEEFIKGVFDYKNHITIIEKIKKEH